MLDNPLVSCVMPTKNRRPFIGASIDCWLKQTYENRELIVVDDGEDGISDLIPKDERIRYIRQEVPSRMSTGTKRNFCNSLVRGEIIAHFDDDDWSAPERLEDQVRRLQQTGMPVTGYGVLLFWDVVKQCVKRYRPHMPTYVCGTTLCYQRTFWQEHQFPNKQVASDNDFVYPILKRIAASSEIHMVARIHDCHHTSAKTAIKEIVAKDLIPAAFWENEKLRLG